jgi:regulation of enolase protein 1 (concanavalin A-like superfamily)
MWVREDRSGWRVTTNGLEVLVQPGNMWGSQNNARNILVRRLPEGADGQLELAVTVENRPTHQYEQANLVWYYDDSHMVKIGQELVDGQLSIVMGREEADQCRTIAIIPLASDRVRVRFVHKAGKLEGSFQLPGSSEWQPAGECTVPAPKSGVAKASLQFYQGPSDREHWAKVREFMIRKTDG